MIEYQVDEQMLEEVQAKLGAMKAKAPTVISRALNKVAVTARVDLANKAQATYTVKSGGFKKDMTIRKASAGRLEAVIHSEGRPLDIDRFHITAPKKTGAKARDQQRRRFGARQTELRIRIKRKRYAGADQKPVLNNRRNAK